MSSIEQYEDHEYFFNGNESSFRPLEEIQKEIRDILTLKKASFIINSNATHLVHLTLRQKPSIEGLIELSYTRNILLELGLKAIKETSTIVQAHMFQHDTAIFNHSYTYLASDVSMLLADLDLNPAAFLKVPESDN